MNKPVEKIMYDLGWYAGWNLGYAAQRFTACVKSRGVCAHLYHERRAVRRETITALADGLKAIPAGEYRNHYLAGARQGVKGTMK